MGKPLFDLIPDAKEVFLPVLNQVRQSGETLYLYEQPYSVITNGKKINGYLNLVLEAYKEVDKTITGVTVLCQDVTETVSLSYSYLQNFRKANPVILDGDEFDIL